MVGIVRQAHGSRRGRQALLAIGAVGAALLLPACDPAAPLVVTVNDPGIAADADPGDGVCETTAGSGSCTLRAAIEETNANPGADEIILTGDLDPTPGGAVPITGTLTVRGNDALLAERLVHTAGGLELHDLTIAGATGAPTCGGAISSTGDQVMLVHVDLRDNATTANSGGAVCTTGRLLVLDSTITNNRVAGTTPSGSAISTSGELFIARSTISENHHESWANTPEVASTGPGTLMVSNSTIGSRVGRPALDAATATGTITASRFRGVLSLNPGVTIAGTIVDGSCESGRTPTSGGYNRYSNSGCPWTWTDAVVSLEELSTAVPAVWSPLVDAIPAGTPGLCPGPVGTDQVGTARPLHEGCEIGPIELRTGVRSTEGDRWGAIFNGVNDEGALIGVDSRFGSQGWEYTVKMWDASGAATDLSAVGSPTAISNDGSVVGVSATDPGKSYLRTPDGTVTLIDPLDGDTAITAADAEGDWVVGGSSRPGTTRPFARRADGALIALPTLGGGTGSVTDVNESGIATGSSTAVPGGPRRATLWDLEAGTVTDISGGSANATYGTAIAENGDVVGTENRPDLPEVCSADLLPACPARRPFTWTAATGTFTRIPGPDGPVVGTGFGPGGTVIATVRRSVSSCAGCPQSSMDTYVFDPASGSYHRLTSGSFAAADVNAGGLVVGQGFAGTVPGGWYLTGAMVTVRVAS